LFTIHNTPIYTKLQHNMKKILTASLAMATLVSSVSAATMTFGRNGDLFWDDVANGGIANNTTTNGVFTHTQDGVTFTLTVITTGDSEGSTGNINYQSSGNNAQLGVRGDGGIGNSHSRIGDTETVQFKLSVSGSALDSLSMTEIKLGAFTSGGNDAVSYTDGTNSGTHIAGGSLLRYTGSGTSDLTEAGLAPLTKDNTDIWKLEIGAMADGTNPQGSFGADYITFDYVVKVPEPSSTALLGLGGLALLLRRRK